jgi:hypothetical protein
MLYIFFFQSTNGTKGTQCHSFPKMAFFCRQQIIACSLLKHIHHILSFFFQMISTSYSKYTARSIPSNQLVCELDMGNNANRLTRRWKVTKHGHGVVAGEDGRMRPVVAAVDKVNNELKHMTTWAEQ